MNYKSQLKRLLAAMRKETLASKIGVTTQSLDNWKAGRKKPIPAFRRKIDELYKALSHMPT